MDDQMLAILLAAVPEPLPRECETATTACAQENFSMAVTNELSFPETEDRFEEMCFHLFRNDWKDPGCTRLGGTGQGQHGLDIIGVQGSREVGVQCKHYVKKPFTLATIETDLTKLDRSSVVVDHLIFATTAPSKTDLVIQVRVLSAARKKSGKCTVSVAFWQEISGMLRLNKEVAKEYIPGFPGGAILQVQATVETTLAVVRSSAEQDSEFQADVRGQLTSIAEQVSSAATVSLPQSRGTEAEPLIAKSLDLVRDAIQSARIVEAYAMLDSLGNPDRFSDSYSRFRWHTHRAAVLLLEDKREEAAREYLVGAAADPTLEKAWINRAHAHLLLGDSSTSLRFSEQGLQVYPESASLWALRVAARDIAGQEEPEHDVPTHIKSTSDVLFTLSHVRYKQKRLEEAFDMMRRSIELEGKSLEVRRRYLSSALSWATSDATAAFHDQLSTKQRDGVVDALRRLEPLESTIAALQSDEVSKELSHNVCVGLMLTRDLRRARALAVSTLVRHPTLEGLLRMRMEELADKDDIAEMRRLSDGQLETLPDHVLATLAEVSANRGDLTWHASVTAVLKGRDSSLPLRTEFRALTIHAHWQAGDVDEATRRASELLAEQPQHVLTRVLLSRMLQQNGKVVPAAQNAQQAMASLRPDSPGGDVLYVANLFHERQLYPEAAALYERVALHPGRNVLTQKYLACLVESGQRRKAGEILASLPSEVRDLPPFRRIESNLARKMGDWPRMRDVLKAELDRTPTDSGVALGYVAALYHLADERDTLTKYLASDPFFDGRQPLNEVEFAKYQREFGYSSLALRRLYRLFRRHPTNSVIGGHFLAPLLIGRPMEELATAPEAITPGTTVTLRFRGEVRTVVVDFDDVVETSSWPELVRPSSDTASTLLGKAVGDVVTLDSAMGSAGYEVIGVASAYHFARLRAHELLNQTASSEGPLYSIKIENPDGSLDVDRLLDMGRRTSAGREDAFANYAALRLPLATLAQLLGTEPLTLMLDWPGAKSRLFVGLGTREEREESVALLASQQHRVVLDLATLGELVEIGRAHV